MLFFLSILMIFSRAFRESSSIAFLIASCYLSYFSLSFCIYSYNCYSSYYYTNTLLFLIFLRFLRFGKPIFLICSVYLSFGLSYDYSFKRPIYFPYSSPLQVYVKSLFLFIILLLSSFFTTLLPLLLFLSIDLYFL